MEFKKMDVFLGLFFILSLATALFTSIYMVSHSEEEKRMLEAMNQPIVIPVEEIPMEEIVEVILDDDEPTPIIDYPFVEATEDYKAYDEIPLDEDIQVLMQKLCKEYHVGFAFALAIMESESSFRPNVTGDGGKSIGYMQINRPNWYRYDKDAHEVEENVEIGIRILSELIEKYEECDKVVMAYKGGESFMLSYVEQGKRLDACDTIAQRAMYWQGVIDGLDM